MAYYCLHTVPSAAALMAFLPESALKPGSETDTPRMMNKQRRYQSDDEARARGGNVSCLMSVSCSLPLMDSAFLSSPRLEGSPR